MTSVRAKDRLTALFTARRRVLAGEQLVGADQSVRHLFRVQSGWLIEYVLLADGRRQVLRILLPGDSFGVAGMFRTRVPHAVAAVTDSVALVAPAASLRDLWRAEPEVALALLGDLSEQLVSLGARQLAIGRMSARERMAQLLLELHDRMAALQRVRDGGFELPLPQEVLADALGISPVHVSRTLSALRAEGLIGYRKGFVQLLSPDRLASLGQGTPPTLLAGE